MADQIYTALMERFSRQGGVYSGMDIPEFYAMAEELFTRDEARAAAAMPKGLFSAAQLAEALGGELGEVESLLEAMADKGLCICAGSSGESVYALPPLVPGIFEFQFMRGGDSDRDRKLARLIGSYKDAVDARRGVVKIRFPGARVITVNEKVDTGNTVHTYDQVVAYVRDSDPIAVSTCYCRHEAQLIDPADTCGKPNEVCMQLGQGARFVIDHGMGREISKDEALRILKDCEEEGLVHCSVNRQNIEFICNCCADHCVIIKTALAQDRPGLALNSGFEPKIDPDECTACEECVDSCPAEALEMGEEDVPELDRDRCFGCGVCATCCPTDGISMVAKPGYPAPPLDHAAFKQALRDAKAGA